MLRAMSCPWFYSKNGSDYVAVGSTVTGNNKLFWFVSLQNLDSSGETLGRTYTQSIQAELTVKRLRLNRNWLLTGLFPSNRAVQIQLSVSLKKVWGSKICATVQLAWSTSSYMGSGLSLKHRYSSLISKNVASLTFNAFDELWHKSYIF